MRSERNPSSLGRVDGYRLSGPHSDRLSHGPNRRAVGKLLRLEHQVSDILGREIEIKGHRQVELSGFDL